MNDRITPLPGFMPPVLSRSPDFIPKKVSYILISVIWFIAFSDPKCEPLTRRVTLSMEQANASRKSVKDSPWISRPISAHPWPRSVYERRTWHTAFHTWVASYTEPWLNPTRLTEYFHYSRMSVHRYLHIPNHESPSQCFLKLFIFSRETSFYLIESCLSFSITSFRFLLLRFKGHLVLTLRWSN